MKYIRLAQIKKILNLSDYLVRKIIDNGSLPSMRMGNQRFVKDHDVMVYRESMSHLNEIDRLINPSHIRYIEDIIMYYESLYEE